MMRNGTAILAAAGAALSASVAFAETAPAVPKPAPQMAQLNVFTGQWSCFGRQADSIFGTAHPIDTLQLGTADLDGFWVVVRYTELRTGDNDHPSTGVYQYGYDPAGKQYLATWTDNFGGWGTQTSPGWQGNKLVLTGDYNSNGQRIPARDTFEQASTTQIVHTSELQANGQWIPLQSETCSKQSG